MSLTGAVRFNLSSRPSTRFHGDVVACVGDVKSQLASGGTVFLTAASTGELERYADICREYEVPYVLGESESAAAGFTAEGALESAGLVLLRAPFGEGTAFPDAKLTIFGNADLFDVAPSVDRPSRKIRTAIAGRPPLSSRASDSLPPCRTRSITRVHRAPLPSAAATR